MLKISIPFLCSFAIRPELRNILMNEMNFNYNSLRCLLRKISIRAEGSIIFLYHYSPLFSFI